MVATYADILNKDWSGYDRIKVKQGGNPNFINLTIGWEINYLVDKIIEQYPHLDRYDLKIALNAYTQLVSKPTRDHVVTDLHRRDHVIEWVLKRLAVVS